MTTKNNKYSNLSKNELVALLQVDRNNDEIMGLCCSKLDKIIKV